MDPTLSREAARPNGDAAGEIRTWESQESAHSAPTHGVDASQSRLEHIVGSTFSL